MAQLWTKDRAKGDHVETAKEKCARYATLTTIDELGIMVSQNEVLYFYQASHLRISIIQYC